MLTDKDLITGMMVHYYVVCPTKLWLFSRGITMEEESELVRMGRILHEIRYKGEEKELLIDRIKVDFVRKGGILEVHETKKSDALEEADIAQVKYYLYVLRSKGIDTIGYIHYPSTKKVVKVSDTEHIQQILQDIRKILSQDKPPKPIKKPYCRKCAYRELCFG